jgi:two-component system LytT family response regulator
MKVLIVEDEFSVAENLIDILKELDEDIEVVSVAESVSECVNFLQENTPPDLGFFDIRLADGLSFEIFDQVKVNFPVIFTTAYDEYSLKAFKVNSIDYLLKPINKDELAQALEKYTTLYPKDQTSNAGILKLLSEFKSKSSQTFRNRILVHSGNKLIPLEVSEISYFYLKNELVYCITHKNKKHTIDIPLNKLAEQLDPKEFFRVNRQFLVSKKSVQSAEKYFNRKLKLNLDPPAEEDIIISKNNITEFKNWLSL